MENFNNDNIPPLDYAIKLEKPLNLERLIKAIEFLQKDHGHIRFFAPDHSVVTGQIFLGTEDPRTVFLVASSFKEEDIIHDIMTNFLFFEVGMFPIPKYKIIKHQDYINS